MEQSKQTIIIMETTTTSGTSIETNGVQAIVSRKVQKPSNGFNVPELSDVLCSINVGLHTCKDSAAGRGESIMLIVPSDSKPPFNMMASNLAAFTDSVLHIEGESFTFRSQVRITTTKNGSNIALETVRAA